MPGLFRIRRSRAGDMDALMLFYRTNRSSRLPTPLIDALQPAVRDGTVFLVEDASFGPMPGTIVAAGGIFFTIEPPCPHAVLEFGAMRSTRDVGGLSPMSMQEVLLQLRMLYVASILPPVSSQVALTVQCYVYGGKKDGSETGNIRSLDALTSAGFEELSPHPDWVTYDVASWSANDEKWIVLFAGERAGPNLVERLKSWEWEGDQLLLRRGSLEQPGVVELFRFSFEEATTLRDTINRLLNRDPALFPLPWSRHPERL
jgi:hypothetical protein